jgi:hypothetical protein
MAFPQRWDGTTLDLRILASPRGNPLNELTLGAPPFAQAALKLNALLIPSLQRLPTPADVSAEVPLNLAMPANAEPLFRELANFFPIDPNPPAPLPPVVATRIKKYLPPSYQAAFAFERPRTSFAFTDLTFACALTNAVDRSRPPRPKPPPQTTWGRVLALTLRQTLLAEALGLVYHARVVPPVADFFRDGGWIYVNLDPASPYAAQAATTADFVKLYAARIPPLVANAAAARPLFAAVLFPVRTVPGAGAFDEIFIEAEAYDDGFAKIVHTFQPNRHDSLDVAGAGPDRPKPVHDIGIKLGWDDEQLTIWMNRQLTDDPRNFPATAADTPMGVRAYRIDVRQVQDGAASGPWTSLVRVQGKLSLGQVMLGVFDGELGVEVAPVQLEGQKDGDYWLPPYLTQWRGTSLVTADPTRDLLAGVAPRPQSPLWPIDADKVPLLYGRDYEFRVRLADVTGGGPGPFDSPVNSSPAGVSICRFRRFVPPKDMRIGAPEVSPDGRSAAYQVLRPLIGYPVLVFTDFANAKQALIDDVSNAQNEKREVGLPDPDVTLLRVDVAVGGLAYDPANLLEPGEALRPLYTAVRAFPSSPADPLMLTLLFQDAPDIATFPTPGVAGPLPVPTGRDLRIIATPVARPDPAMATGGADPVLVADPDPLALDLADAQLQYFGSQAARLGLPTTVRTRCEPDNETGLLSDIPGRPFQVLLLQPDPAPGTFLAALQAAAGLQGQAPTNLAQRLAEQIGLTTEGLFFTDRPGRRTVFGCSAALRHVLAPDRSSITFSSKSDLTGHWIAVVLLQLNRDWTWDALDDTGFEVRRNLGAGDEFVGNIPLPRSVNALVVRSGVVIDRSTTRLIFFDAIDPKPAVGSLPIELTIAYTVTPRFKKEPTRSDWPWRQRIGLPIAAPPTQVPRVVSAGLALSPYHHDPAYSATRPRQRMLWLEFAEPVLNPRDTYFARVLAHSADPLLTGSGPDPPPGPSEPPLSIDPELIRVITPGQSDDSAGLNAMQQLVPSDDSPRHFLLPLPPDLHEGARELFGFFVYELRIGHVQGWSTAQARFGPRLRITGVQHPAPPLTCLANRSPSRISASAPFAIPVANGQVLISGRPLQTQLWVLLYAQVLQADGGSWRNILLGRAPAPFGDKAYDGQTGPQPYGVAFWNQADVLRRLTALGLPADAPLSVLAVELLPEPSAAFLDPLGANLGQVRILRTSPLTPVPAVCLDTGPVAASGRRRARGRDVGRSAGVRGGGRLRGSSRSSRVAPRSRDGGGS